MGGHAGFRIVAQPGETLFREGDAGDCAYLIESGAIRPIIHSTFPAADAARAHALMESNQHVGKIVLTW